MSDQYPRTRGRQYESDYLPNHGDDLSTLRQPSAAEASMAEVRAYEHMVRVQIMKVHKVRILPLYSELACACHSAPHPAARDYRRRTKRRRRRTS